MEISNGQEHMQDTSPEFSHKPQELNDRLIEYTNEELVYDPDISRPTIEIIEDNVIAVRGIALKLSPAKIFTLNAFRLWQGYSQTASDLVVLGFKGERDTLKVAAARLVRQLNELADEPLVEVHRETKKEGAPNVYTLLPEVEIVDKRSGTAAEHKELAIFRGVRRDPNGEPLLTETGAAAFLAPRHRENITRMMIHDFRELAKVDEWLAHMFREGIQKRTNTMPIQMLKFMRPLEQEEETHLLYRKEQGLLAYVGVSRQHLSAEEQAIIIDGVLATYELFARNLNVVARLAKMYSTDRVPFAELYQEGAMQLMGAVLHQQYFSDGLQNFRYIAAQTIKSERGRGLHPMRYKTRIPDVHIPSEFTRERRRINDTIDSFELSHGRKPSVHEISTITSMSHDKIIGIGNVDKGVAYLDAEIPETNGLTLLASLEEDDFVDDELDRMERQDAIDAIFRSKDLSDDEKLILSLKFQLFHPSLALTKPRGKHATQFVYPSDELAFASLIAKPLTMRAIATKFLGRSEQFVYDGLTRALRKSRTVLQNFDGFDSSEYSPYVNTDTLEYIDNLKSDIVSLALEVSPSERLGTKELRALCRTGDFPVNEREIVDLFGSLPDFHRACGFAPDKGWESRGMSNQEIVDLALSINPRNPLKTGEIKILSRHQEFVSAQAIYTKFGSIKAFRDACAAEIQARSIQK